MNLRLLPFLLSGLLIFSPFLGIFASEVLRFVAWKAIEDANGYQVQIKDAKGKVIVDKKIEKNYYSIQDLPTGDMFVRTAPLNAFLKPVVWSPWTELEVLLSITPTIEIPKDKPKPVVSQDKPISQIAIEGDHFLDVTEIELSQKQRKLPILEKNYVNEKRIDVKVDTTNAKPGDYDLTIVNPFQKPQKIANFMSLEAKPFETPKDPPKIELPPPPPPKEEVVVPQGKPYHEYSYPEFMAFLDSVKAAKPCATLVPEPAVAECFNTYITIRDKSKDSRDIFAFFRLINDNETDRYYGYEYFEKQCAPIFRPAKERFDHFLEKERGNVDPLEITRVRMAQQRLRECGK